MRRRALLAVAAPLAFAACGFELRRSVDLPFATIALAGFAPRSPIAAALRRAIGSTAGTRVVDTPAQAEAVLESLADAHERAVVASTAAGQVREIQLRSRLRFRLRTPGGRELIAPVELLLTRDMSYSETAALAKEQEEALMFDAMDEDIARQVLRRVAAAGPAR